jgi:hypothetical protein
MHMSKDLILEKHTESHINCTYENHWIPIKRVSKNRGSQIL